MRLAADAEEAVSVAASAVRQADTVSEASEEAASAAEVPADASDNTGAQCSAHNHGTGVLLNKKTSGDSRLHLQSGLATYTLFINPFKPFQVYYNTNSL